jgi:hypothetical protein
MLGSVSDIPKILFGSDATAAELRLGDSRAAPHNERSGRQPVGKFLLGEVHPVVHRYAQPSNDEDKTLIFWRSLGESNPCFSLERADLMPAPTQFGFCSLAIAEYYDLLRPWR